jgi:MYXO-CTERM domain-containing protein
VTTSACLAAAGVVYPSCPLNLGPVTSTTTSTQLVTSVNQCNGIVTGGGSNVYCNVAITNNVPAATPESGVTIDQCIGSVTGMGGTVACAPNGSTTNATVTQCNGSVTGGGTYAGEPTAACTVTGAATADPVTVNQCNGTATGGGSAVTCMATVADVFASTTTPTSAPTGTGVNGAAAVGGAGAGGGGAGGSTGVAGTSGTVAAVIPTGAPQTGFGGASQSTNSALVYVGDAALAAAGMALAVTIRRRRRASAHSLQSHLS